MKITQALIDQAAMIANAKVGDELEESRSGRSWTGLCQTVFLNEPNYTYRIKPQPRVVYCNLQGSCIISVRETAAEACNCATSYATAIAVPFQQIGEGEKP